MPEMLPKWVATSPSDGPTDIRISDIQIALPTPEAADLSGMPITIEHLRGLIGICSQRISIESNTRPSSRISEIDPPQLAAETTVGQFLSAVLNVINVHLPGEKVMALLEGSCVRKLSKFHSGSDNTPFADIDIMIALPHHSMYESAGPDKLPVKEII
ncbi:hypothetical protein EBR96_08140, partial [bacterium]|nr:hypothetical protein [bacterium]